MAVEESERLEYLKGERKKAILSHVLVMMFVNFVWASLIFWIKPPVVYGFASSHPHFMTISSFSASIVLSYFIVEQVFGISIIKSWVEEMATESRLKGEKRKREKIERKAKLLYILVWALQIIIVAIVLLLVVS